MKFNAIIWSNVPILQVEKLRLKYNNSFGLNVSTPCIIFHPLLLFGCLRLARLILGALSQAQGNPEPQIP